MTHRNHRNGFEFDAQAEVALPDPFYEVMELLCQHGFNGMARAMETLFNEAMKLERADVLGALPYERTADRRGFAALGVAQSAARGEKLTTPPRAVGQRKTRRRDGAGGSLMHQSLETYMSSKP